MALKFEPPVEVARYALSIGRFFKTYNSVGHAKMAYHHHARYTTTPARILEQFEGQWFVLYQVDNPRSIEYWRDGGPQLPWYKPTTGYVYNRETETGEYTSGFRAKPMTTAEYAAWRVQVEHELLAQKPIEQLIAMFDTVPA